ncbi:helix-turn-helix domain-containing protein [uncultured Marixanthomonas sp.]|uniref:helix-turn-helix domain-containing protein n=1 Tax=uncultured Marixanthomonas sp. TaxID=757245 RepID=UPI0030DBCE16|tara:strand:- start:120455 stop:121657 length:1203 start_codon:yes stop_codon:yes gene_type:complete
MLFFGVENWAMFVDFILIAGMSLLFLLVVFLLKSNTGFSKKLLSIFFINSIFFLLYYYAYLHKSRSLGGIAVLLGSGTGFLLGPFLLFYIRSLIQPANKVIKQLLLHLTPFFVYWIAISLPVALSMVFGLFSAYHKQYVLVADYINLIENAYFLGYIWIAFQGVQTIRKAREQTYSFIESSNLTWISYLIIGLFGIVIIDSLFSVYELIFPRIPWNIGTLIAVALILLYCVLGYKGMFQSQILLPNFLLEEAVVVAPTTTSAQKEEVDATVKPVRQLDVFTATEIEGLKKKLHAILVTQKPHLNEALSLSQLAAELDITDKKLSELLNQHLHTNFYNFINDYRVKEVKEKLTEAGNEKYTLLSVAYDCGFQSKTSFNRVFKQKTGMSPSKYRQLHTPVAR